jgi:hypothetical protein
MRTLIAGRALLHRLLSALALLLLLPTLSVEAPEAASLHVSEETAMRFEANLGQTDATVDYVARGRDYQVFLTKPGAVIVLQAPRPARVTGAGSSKVTSGDAQRSRAVVRMSLLGALADPPGVPDQPAGSANYLLGNDPTRWRNVPSWARVRYQSVYPGIDLVYYGNQRRLEYDFVVRPGANPEAIRLALTGSVDGNPEPLFHADTELVARARSGPRSASSSAPTIRRFRWSSIPSSTIRPTSAAAPTMLRSR